MATDLRIGDRIRDNDPRLLTRVLTITGVDETHVRASPHGTQLWATRIRRDRIHADGKPRRSGFSLLPREAAS